MQQNIISKSKHFTLMIEYRKLSPLVMVIILWMTGLFGQAPDTLWTKTYGGAGWDEGNSVRETIDNGYIIAGCTGSFSSSDDVYLIKTDADGGTLWTKTYGGVYGDGANSVQQTSDSGYILTGYTYSFGAGKYDVYLIKTDEMGTASGQRLMEGRMATKVTQFSRPLMADI